jgi:hypothetical protein
MAASGVFKSSSGAMNEGSAALQAAVREIGSSKAQLEAAYKRLQGQWRSSEARGKADKEYAAVVEWLESAIRWSQAGANTTDEVNAMFARVEASGIS